MIDPPTLELKRDANAPGAAREFVAGQLVGLDAEVRADTALMVSEVVTNVVRHGELPAHLVLDVDGQRIQVSVYDSSPELPPRVPTSPASDAGSGRGLLIVAALARAWGVRIEPALPGKYVWFEVDLTGLHR